MSYDEYKSKISTIRREILTNKAFSGLISTESTEEIDETFAMLYDIYFKTK